jgi:hypothetical protein
LLVLGLLVAGITDHRSGQNRQSNDLAADESRPLGAFHGRVSAVDSKGFEIRFSDRLIDLAVKSPGAVIELGEWQPDSIFRLYQQ